MNTTEWFLLIVTLINVIVLFLVYSIHNKVLTNTVHIQNLLAGIGTVITRTSMTDHNVQKLSSAFTEFVDATGNLVDKIQMMSGMSAEGLYRTMDGKYSAKTIEELIHKIRRDNNESSYFNEDELDKLRQLFVDDDDDDDEESII